VVKNNAFNHKVPIAIGTLSATQRNTKENPIQKAMSRLEIKV